jgi:hypothetical protein
MATPQSVALVIVSRVLSDTTVTAWHALPLARREPVPVGETHATGIFNVTGLDATQSNINRCVASMVITILHHLADPHDENTYKTGDMIADQQVLTDRGWWRSLAGVYDATIPELDEAERIGNIYEYNVVATVSIVPD